MIDLDAREIQLSVNTEMSAMDNDTIIADNSSLADKTIKIFDNTDGFLVNSSSENVISNKDDLLIINTRIGTNPMMLYYMRISKNLYDSSLEDIQFEKTFQFYYKSPFGAIRREIIQLRNFVSARYQANCDDILIPMKKPIMVDASRYLSMTVAPKTKMTIIFYYKQLNIHNSMIDSLTYNSLTFIDRKSAREN